MNRILGLLLVLTLPAVAQRQMEDLGRGVIAVRTGSASTYVSWRMIGSDDDHIAFNLYRTINGGTPSKLNGSPLTSTTDYQDNPGSGTLNGSTVGYFVRPIVDGVEQASSASRALPAGSPTGPYFDVSFTTDPGPDGPYKTKFAWVGDFNGDGEYDFLCDRISTVGSNEQFLEAYLQDGTFLWRMHMGQNSLNQNNIEPSSSTISAGDCDNLTVFDLDGDGRAEAIVRTANGVSVTNPAGATVTSITAANNSSQFLTVVDGMSGVEIDSVPVPNNWPQHGPFNSRCYIAYLDGKHPSVILHGNNRADDGDFYIQMTAWDFVGGELVQRWTWLQPPGVPGAEGHQIRIADVDNDGRDEIVDIGHVLDDDGSDLYVTELVHGDRFHVADINPLLPGLETYAIQQNNPTFLATAYMASSSGYMHRKWYSSGIVDVGRGLSVDMDPNYRGMEMFSTQPGIYNADGDKIFANSNFPFEGLWWDGDTGREFIMGPGSGSTSPAIEKFNPATGGNSRIYVNGTNLYNYGVHQANGGRPAFWGDILGDWREELVLVKNDYSGLRIFTTMEPADDRRRTLMHNAQYRVQTTTKGYTQASYVDYYLGFETTEDPPPPINDTDHLWVSGPGFDASTCPPGESILFDLSGDNSAPVALSGTLSPSRLKVFSPIDYHFDGSSGAFSGSMKLVKSGSGTMTLDGDHPFDGSTEVWDGALIVNGTLSSTPITIHGGTWGGPLAMGETGGRLGGSGTIAQAVELAWRGTIAPGDGNGQPATLSLGSSLTCAEDTTLSLDLSNSSSSDLIAITGDLTLLGATTLAIHTVEAELDPGTHTLVTYGGNFNGSLDDFEVVMPTGTPYSLSDTGSAIQLVIPVTRAPASITWNGGENTNTWDLFNTPNFLLNGLPEPFISGDVTTFDDSGSPNTSVDLAGELSIGNVVVNSSLDYTFGGSGNLTGSGRLTKTGSGTLSLGSGHRFTGPVAINGGTLAVADLSDAGVPSSIGAASDAASNLVIDSGTLRLDGPQSNTNRSMRLGNGGGTFDIPDESLQISGSIEGPGSLTKTGDDLLILAQANNYTGGTFIHDGTLQLATDLANAEGLGSGPVTFLGGSLSMTDSRSFGSYDTVSYDLIVPDGEAGRLNADGRCNIEGTLSGGGDFTFHTPFVRTALRANWSEFSGKLSVITDADGGDFRIDSTHGFGGATLDLGADVFAYYYPTMNSNLTLDIGALSGETDAVLLGGSTSGRTLTWRIGENNIDSNFSGDIDEQGGSTQTALEKIGTGNLTLAGTANHRGGTRIGGGILRIEGSSTASDFTVLSGGTLGGGGSISGRLSLQSGSQLELGPDPLAIEGNVGATGNITVHPLADPGPGTHIIATYSGSFSGSPTFVWSGPYPYEADFSTTGGQISVTLDPVAGDSDGDLIDDSWELRYYPSVATAGPLDDTDGDGFNTWSEWKAGTDPTNDASRPGTTISGSMTVQPVADTAIWYRDGNPSYASTNYGTDIDIDNYAYPSIPIIALGYFRFDLSSIPGGSTIDSSTLTFTKLAGNPRQPAQGGHSDHGESLNSGRFAVYGLLDIAGSTAQDWDESTLTGGASGLEFEFTNAGSDPPVDTASRTTNLDGVGETVDGTTASISDGSLNDFLQSRLDAGSHRGLATFITDIENGSNGKGYAFGSRESESGTRPALEVSYSESSSIPDEDEDDDRLLDAWEAQYFGTLDRIAEDDSDGDHTPEWLEQALGTDPTDRSQFFHAEIIGGPESPILTWHNGPGIIFTVESSITLGAPWSQDAIVQGSTDPPDIAHPISSDEPRRFFRIQAEPSP